MVQSRSFHINFQMFQPICKSGFRIIQNITSTSWKNNNLTSKRIKWLIPGNGPLLRCGFRNKQKFKPHENAKLTEWDFWLFGHVWLIYFMLIDMISLILQYPWISVHVHDCPFSELVLLFGISERSHIGPILNDWDLWGHSIPACSELLFLITKPSSLKCVIWNLDYHWKV